MRLDKVSDRVYANTEGKTGGNVGIVWRHRIDVLWKVNRGAGAGFGFEGDLAFS